MNFFHPRRQRWDDHFRLRGAVIEPLTPEGKATARLLKLNLDKRVVERWLLTAVGRTVRDRVLARLALTIFGVGFFSCGYLLANIIMILP